MWQGHATTGSISEPHVLALEVLPSLCQSAECGSGREGEARKARLAGMLTGCPLLVRACLLQWQGAWQHGSRGRVLQLGGPCWGHKLCCSCCLGGPLPLVPLVEGLSATLRV